MLVLAVLGLVSASSAREGRDAPYRPDPNLTDEGAAELPRGVEREQRRRDTREASEERRASRGRHRGRDRRAAAELARETFGFALERPAWRPLELEDGQQVEEYRGSREALVRAQDGGRTLVQGMLPLRSSVGTGELAPVDLSLEERDAGFELANPLVSTVIDDDPRRGVRLGDEITMRLVTDSAADAPLTVRDKAFFANAATDTDFVLSPAPTGVEAAWHVRSAESPESATLQFDVPEGARLQESERLPGAVDVMGADGTLATVQPPVGWDAEGADVPVSYAIEGDRLTVRFAHRDEDLAYPLYVDPLVDFYRLDGAGNRTEPNDGTFAGWQTTQYGASFAYSRNSASYGHGLHVYTLDGVNYPDRAFGEWYYRVTRSQAFIARADFGYVSHESNFTCVFEGIYNGSNTGWENGRWEHPVGFMQPTYYPSSVWAFDTPARFYPSHDNRNPCATLRSNYKAHYPEAPTNGNSMVFGLQTFGNRELNPRALAYMYGAAVHLDDRQAPVIVSTSGPQGWVDQGSSTFGVRGRDAGGLGVRGVNLFAGGQSAQGLFVTKTGGYTPSQSGGCTGSLYRNACPEEAGVFFTINNAALPEGQQTVTGAVYDALDKAVSYSVPVKADHTAPAVTLSGPLLEGGTRGLDYGPSYRLDVVANDPLSGVGTIEVLVDGQRVANGLLDRGCTASTGCTAGDTRHSVSVNTSAMAYGKHTVVVKATDAVGRTQTETREFTLSDRDAPDLRVQGGLRSFPVATGRSFTATATDTSSGVADIRVFVKPTTQLQPDAVAPTDAQRKLLAPCTSGCRDADGFEASYTLPDATASGRYQFTVEARDAQGNMAEERWVVAVVQTRSGRRERLGLEQWFELDDTDAGGEATAYVNGETGNFVWHHVPVVNPGRGLSTVVNLTYNSQDRGGLLGLDLGRVPLLGFAGGDQAALGQDLTGLAYREAGVNMSVAIGGPTRVNEPLGNALAAGNVERTLPRHDSGWPAAPEGRVTMTDADGTQHVFSRANGGTAWEAPPGVDLRLRYVGQRPLEGQAALPALRALTETQLDQQTAWELLRPDGVRHLFDAYGYLRRTTDRNGNALSYVYKAVSAITGQDCASGALLLQAQEDVGACVPQLQEVRQPGYSTTDTRRRVRLEYTPAAQTPTGSLLSNFDIAPETLMGASFVTGDAPQIARIIDASDRVYALEYWPSGPLRGYLKELRENDTQVGGERRVTRFGYNEPNCPTGANTNTSASGSATAVAPGDAQQMTGIFPFVDGAERPATEICYEPRASAVAGPPPPRRVVRIRKRDGAPKLYRYTAANGGTGAGFFVHERTAGTRYVSRQTTLDANARPQEVVESTSELSSEAAVASEVASQGRTVTKLQWDDGENKPLTIMEAAGTAAERVTMLTYSPTGSGALTERVVAAGTDSHTTTLEYFGDREGGFIADLKKIVEPGGRTWAFEVDARGNTTVTTDPNGVRAETRYDAAKNYVVMAEQDLMGRWTTFSGHDANGMPTRVERPGAPGVPRVWRYGYDPRGDVVKVVDPRNPAGATGPGDPYVTTLAYDGFSRLITEQIPRLSAPVSDRELPGEPARIERRRRFDRDGNAVEITDARGFSTLVTYDRAGQATAVDAPGSLEANGGGRREVSRYVYDDAQRLIAEVLPRGAAWSNPDASAAAIRGEQTAVCEGTGAQGAAAYVTRYCLDHRGRPQARVQYSESPADMSARIWSFVYDGRGNQLGETDPNRNASRTADGRQQPLRIADAIARIAENPARRRVSTAYDVLDRVRVQTERPTDGGSIRARRLTYNPAGDVVTTSQDDADGGARATQMTYDAAGRMLTQTDPLGRMTCWRRQADGLVSALTTPRGTAGTTTDRCRTGAPYTAHTTSYSYNHAGEVLSRSIPFADGQYGPTRTDVRAWKVQYERDLAGNPSKITDARGNVITNLFYDSGELRQTSRPSFWQLQWPADQANPDGGQRYGGSDAADIEVAQGGPVLSEREGRSANAERSGEAPEKPESLGRTDFGDVQAAELPAWLPQAGATKLRYDLDMRLEEVRDADGASRRIAYDPAGRVRQKRWPMEADRPIVHDFLYDANGNLQRTSEDWNAARLETSFGYDGYDRRVSEDAPGSHPSAYTGTPVREITRFAHDANDNLTRRTTPRGTAFGFSYDSLDQLDAETNPVGLTWDYTYSRFGETLTEVSPHQPGADRQLYTTSRAYDRAGQMTRTIRTVDQPGGEAPRSLVSDFTYDPDGNQTRVEEPGAPDRVSTTVDFDGRGLPWRSTVSGGTGTGAASRSRITEFDANGNLRREVNPAGITTGGLPVTADTGDLQTASREARVRVYDADDLQVEERLPWRDAADTRYTRVTERDRTQSAQGWVTGIRMPRAIGDQTVWRTSYRHNQAGWITGMSEQTRSSTTSSDSTRQLNPEFRYEYDEQGNQTRWRSEHANEDDRGRDLTWEYWPSGLLQRRSAIKVLDDANTTSTRTYDYLYNPNRSLVRTIDRDADQQQSGAQPRTTIISRDTAEREDVVFDQTSDAPADREPGIYLRYSQYTGNLTVRQTDRDFGDTGSIGRANHKVMQFGYDSLGRETDALMDRQDNSGIHRRTRTRWHDGGQMRERTKPNGTVDRWAWNALGEKVRHDRVRRGQSVDPSPQEYRYDANGNRTRDERGAHVFNARNQLTRWTRPSDRGREDRRGWRVDYQLDGSGAMEDRVEHDAMGAVKLDTDFTYDGDRLRRTVTSDRTQAVPVTVTQSYRYDDAGNVQRVYAQTQAAIPVSQPAPAETALSPEECEAADATVSTQITRYCYDEFNRQVFSSGSGITQPAQVSYDGLDRRDRRVQQATEGAELEVRDYAYMGTSELLLNETSTPAGASSPTVRSYEYDSQGARLGQETVPTDGAPRYRAYATDANGSVTGLEDADGQIAANETYEYDPYGELDRQLPISAVELETGLSDDAKANPFRFEGFYYDSGVKTYDMHARHYRPEIGRFLSRDQYASAAGDQALQADPLTQNRYAFAGANPVTNIEFDGHDPHGPDTHARGCFNSLCGSRQQRRQRTRESRRVLTATLGAQSRGAGASGTTSQPYSQRVGVRYARSPRAAPRVVRPPGLLGRALGFVNRNTLNVKYNGFTTLQGSEPIFSVANDDPVELLEGASTFTGLGAVRRGAISGGRKLLQKDAAKGGIDESARLGRAGEAAAGITKNTERIPSLSGKAEYRVPDVLDRAGGVIGEVKNVGRLSYGSQLRDYAAYAQQQGLRFDLTVRRTTRLSGPLRDAVTRGDVNLRYLP